MPLMTTLLDASATPAAHPSTTEPVPAAKKRPVVRPVAARAPADSKALAVPKTLEPTKALAARKTKAAVAQTAPEPVSKPAVAAMPAAPANDAKATRAKDKLVRDSFTMPRAEFAVIHELKERALGFKRATKKSELLRAGLQVLAALDDTTLKTVLDMLPKLKAGRPRKGN